MSAMKMKTNRRRGFTLIELLLVLVILGTLAVLVIPKFTGRSRQARETAARADIRVLSSAIDQFENDTGRYPTTEEGLAALITPPSNVTNANAPYIKGGIPKDPWGNPYQYRQPGQHNPKDFDLYSLGADGREGNDDIGNWETERSGS